MERHAQRFVLEQPAVERLAHARDDLHRLGGLDQRDEARQHAEHAALRARRHRARRRRLRVEAAITGAVARVEHGRLPVEAEDRAVHVRPAEQHARVVGEIAGGEVVRAVDDHVVLREQRERVLGREPQRVALDEHVGVHRGDPLRGHVDLRAPDVGGAVEHLAVQVRGVDAVEVDDPERAHARGREILRGRAAEPARADQQHARVEQRALTLEADLGQDQVAPVAIVLLGRERRPRPDSAISGKLARRGFGRALEHDDLRARSRRRGSSARALCRPARSRPRRSCPPPPYCRRA